jgi:prepilin-type N-terminal cleavage/methylation domain-containing protein
VEQGTLALERKRNRHARRRGERGFTLVEILVVITIIGLIMALVGPRVLNYLSELRLRKFKSRASPARSISSISMLVVIRRAPRGSAR